LSGFWKAVLFLVACNLVGLLLRLIFKKIPFVQNFIYWGGSAAAFFIVWNIRHGVGWLIFGIICIIMLIVSSITALKGKKKAKGKEKAVDSWSAHGS
jgi:cellulose synthase/poly-beta-1,6-N-acetylglucosamine synthase-like glycosyltransferase